MSADAATLFSAGVDFGSRRIFDALDAIFGDVVSVLGFLVATLIPL